MSESNIIVTPGSGGPSVDLEVVDNGNARQVICLGDPTAGASVLSVDPVKGIKTQAYQIPADQVQSTTGAAAAGVTITLPAVASQFHYIVFLRIKKIFSVANVASATPLTVTETNLPGALTWVFGQPTGAIGVSDEQLFAPAAPLKSQVAGTSTTIVAPATAGIIWHIAVHYYTAA